MARRRSVAGLLALAIFHLLLSGAFSATLTIVNNCQYEVWPAIISNAGVPSLTPTGFALAPATSKTLSAPSGWGGRVWGRSGCTGSDGSFSCETGDCGGSIECGANTAKGAATLAEFTLNGAGGLDFYDVSLVDGYNLPMLLEPHNGSGGNCTSTDCGSDLNDPCPSDLKVVSTDSKRVLACNSACEAFATPEYCCSGQYGNPNSCHSTSYSKFFKDRCPRAYSYAYDDSTSTFTCASADYVITFCPSAPNSSHRSSQNPAPETPGSPAGDGTMIYQGYPEGFSAATCRHVLRNRFFAGFVAVSITLWRLGGFTGMGQAHFSPWA